MLLVVFTLVEAPDRGWGSARTLGSFALAGAILAAFVAIERRTPAPLVRLGILRSGSLVRANLAAMSLFGGWYGFQFMLTLYLQQLRGWSALETGLAIFPAGLLVATLAPRIAPLDRALRRHPADRRRPGLDARRLRALPADRARLGLRHRRCSRRSCSPASASRLAYGPLNVAATTGIAPEEQGLAGGAAQHLVPVRRRPRARRRDRRRSTPTPDRAGRRRRCSTASTPPSSCSLIAAAVLGIVAVGSGLLFRAAPATVEEHEPQLELEFEAA